MDLKKQAKKIMDDFVKALPDNTSGEFEVKREKNIRDSPALENDPKFRIRMFSNAPKVKDQCILAEKKKFS